LTFYSETLDRLLAQGEAMVRERQYGEGEQRARMVLAQQPRNARGHFLLALSALMQERHAEAYPHVLGALRSDRVNPEYHFMAALCHVAAGRAEEAIASYRRALQYRPRYFQARANLGYVLECLGRVEEAAECYRRVLDEQPREWYSLNRLGYCERILGQPQAALGLLARALEVQPNFAPTHNELALAYMQLWRKPEAIASFRTAVALDPQFLFAWCNLGKVLYLDYVAAAAEGPADSAPVLECFDRILALDPGNAEFAHMRDCVTGARPDRPPDEYIERFFDRFSAQFDEKLKGELEYIGPEAAAAFMASWLGARGGLAVVDLGCGTGLSGTFLRPAAARLVGVDLSGAMLERARERGIYDELVREEIGAFLERQAPASVDLAVALEVFLYVGALERVLAAAARALAPGGRLMFSVELAGDEVDFTLSASGRYAHSARYVEAAARQAGFIVSASTDVAIRREIQRPVPARLFALDRPAP